MTYDDWISRERRIRLKILQNSSVTKSKVYRVCKECDEVCLCHEEQCPNCDSESIRTQYIADLAAEQENRLRCRYRFERLQFFDA